MNIRNVFYQKMHNLFCELKKITYLCTRKKEFVPCEHYHGARSSVG